jgi:capsular polysaccharide transport system permease protein
MKNIDTREMYQKLATQSKNAQKHFNHVSAYLQESALKNLSDISYSKKLNLLFLAFMLVTSTYWLVLASDLYVSESTVIVQRTDSMAAPKADFSALLGNGANTNRADQLLLREYLLSKVVLKKLDDQFDLRHHYANPNQDFASRLWNEKASLEKLHLYFLRRVSIELDEYSSVLKINVEAYDADYALKINKALIAHGELFMNSIAQDLAIDQVEFLQQQVSLLNQKVINGTNNILIYQNSNGLISPKASTENIASIIGQLEFQRTQLETTIANYESYLVPNHNNIVQAKQQLASVKQQILDETTKLVSPKGSKLNKAIGEFERLELELKFATEVYTSALTALEKVRIEAVRNIKKVTLLQPPTLPEYALMPRRIYNTVSFIIIILLFAGVSHLMSAIIRDHRN